MDTIRDKLKLNPNRVIVLLLCLAALLSALISIYDTDFFWHLSTGRWIWESGKIPDQDPFLFTSAAVEKFDTDPRAPFLLKGYWLSQLSLYLLYRTASFEGIVLYKGILYLMLIFFLYLFLKRENVKSPLSYLFLLPLLSHPLFYFLKFWNAERPSSVSFVFTVLLVYLLEGLRKTPKKRYLASLPLIMFLWANMHGGFALGDVIICIYILDIVVSSIRAGKNSFRMQQAFFVACLIALGVSMMNPNTYKVFLVLSDSQRATMITVFEDQSPLNAWVNGINKSFMIYTIVPLLLLVPFIRRLTLPRLLLLSLLGGMAFLKIRYIPFLVFVSTPIAASYWHTSIDRYIEKLRVRPHLSIITVLLLALIVFTNSAGTVFRNPLIMGSYPLRSVEFMKTYKPEPNIYNEYSWGGFLIWHLWPEYKVFTDGRALYYRVHTQYLRVLLVEEHGVRPEWKAILDSYNINTVIIPAVDSVGHYIPLFGALIDDPSWSVVFMDRDSYVFLRAVGKNRSLTDEFAISQRLVVERALKQASERTFQYPGSYMPYISAGILNLYLNRPSDALTCLESAIELNPHLKTSRLPGLIVTLKQGDGIVSPKDIAKAASGF